MKLQERVGYFKTTGGADSEAIKDRISDILLEMVDNGTIESLVNRDELTYSTVSDYNTIIHYDYTAENTVGGAVFVNMEPVKVQVGTGYELQLTVYEEFDGHVEELDRYNENELEILMADLPDILVKSEQEFRHLDRQYQRRTY